MPMVSLSVCMPLKLCFNIVGAPYYVVYNIIELKMGSDLLNKSCSIILQGSMQNRTFQPQRPSSAVRLSNS